MNLAFSLLSSVPTVYFIYILKCVQDCKSLCVGPDWSQKEGSSLYNWMIKVETSVLTLVFRIVFSSERRPNIDI